VTQDEWLDAENWEFEVRPDADRPQNENRASVFSGPFFTRSKGVPVRVIKSATSDFVASIPTGFFKIVALKGKDGKLTVRAFIFLQDADALDSPRKGQTLDLCRYQVTVRMIEELTGLDFPDSVAKANPLFFLESEESKTNGIFGPELPEVIPICTKDDLINQATDKRPVTAPTLGQVVMDSAMINPPGEDLPSDEWVLLKTKGPAKNAAKTVLGWSIADGKGKSVKLGTTSIKVTADGLLIQPLTPVELNNALGALVLLDAEGNLRVLTRSQALQRGHKKRL
jgi:DNA/RNA non-specific endonuclease